MSTAASPDAGPSGRDATNGDAMMRMLAGWLLGVTMTIIIWTRGAAIAGRILAVPDDVDGRR